MHLHFLRICTFYVPFFQADILILFMKYCKKIISLKACLCVCILHLVGCQWKLTFWHMLVITFVVSHNSLQALFFCDPNLSQEYVHELNYRCKNNSTHLLKNRQNPKISETTLLQDSSFTKAYLEFPKHRRRNSPRH